jgi:hypothetical protein
MREAQAKAKLDTKSKKHPHSVHHQKQSNEEFIRSMASKKPRQDDNSQPQSGAKSSNSSEFLVKVVWRKDLSYDVKQLERIFGENFPFSIKSKAQFGHVLYVVISSKARSALVCLGDSDSAVHLPRLTLTGQRRAAKFPPKDFEVHSMSSENSAPAASPLFTEKEHAAAPVGVSGFSFNSSSASPVDKYLLSHLVAKCEHPCERL